MTSREPVPPRRITPLATPTYVAAGSGFPFGDGPLVALVKAALDEDRAFDDVTTISTVISTRRCSGPLLAREFEGLLDWAETLQRERPRAGAWPAAFRS